MNKNQYLDKHRTHNISSQEMDRKWKAFQLEQEMMYEALSPRSMSAVNIGLATGGGAAGGGGAPTSITGLLALANTSPASLIANSLYNIDKETGALSFFKTIGATTDNITLSYNSVDGLIYFMSVGAESKLNSMTLDGIVTEIATIPIFVSSNMCFFPGPDVFLFLDKGEYPPTNVIWISTTGDFGYITAAGFEGNSGLRSLIVYNDTVFTTVDIFIASLNLDTGAIGEYVFTILELDTVPGVNSFKIFQIDNMTSLANSDSIYANVLIQNLDDSSFMNVIVSVDMKTFIETEAPTIIATYVGPGTDIYNLTLTQ